MVTDPILLLIIERWRLMNMSVKMTLIKWEKDFKNLIRKINLTRTHKSSNKEAE